MDGLDLRIEGDAGSTDRSLEAFGKLVHANVADHLDVRHCFVIAETQRADRRVIDIERLGIAEEFFGQVVRISGDGIRFTGAHGTARGNEDGGSRDL